MIVGPWDHLQASSGKEIAKAGYGTLGELQLRWFDHWLKGVADPALDSDIPNLTYFDQGPDTWRTSSDWIDRSAGARSFRLSGSATNAKPAASRPARPQDGTSNVLPIPVQGLCTRSTNQWTDGRAQAIRLPDEPLLQEQRGERQAGRRVRDRAGHRAGHDPGPDQRPPLRLEQQRRGHALGRGGGRRARRHGQPAHRRLAGPLAPRAGRVARPATSTARSSSRSTRSPGRRRRSWPAARSRRSTSRCSRRAATIRPGHKLRLAVQAFDVPHLLPSAPHALGHLTVMKVHTSEQYPSELTLPTLP